MEILSQALGFLAMISLVLSYQQKKREGVITAKLFADIFWALHYLTLGGFAGFIPNFVGIFRELVFLRKNKSAWANSKLWLIAFLITNWTIGAFSFKSGYDILPILASTFVTFSLWLNNTNLTKLLLLPATAGFLVYDFFVLSIPGIINESFGIISILLFFIKGAMKMSKKIFTDDNFTNYPALTAEGAPIRVKSKTITSDATASALAKGELFSNEVSEGFLTDFEKPEDKMAHVSTFIVVGDTIYATYYANTKEPLEDPKNQTARLVYAPLSNLDDKTFFDLQTTGCVVDGKVVDMVYDTILMQKDEDTLFVMWTARVDENYYRFYCPFYISTKKLGKIGVNRFKVNGTVNDFSVSGIRSALAAEGIPLKKMYADIGIMQKVTERVENGVVYYYSGAYSGDFNCIIKSTDFITWEYVSQPDFINDSKWENATFVLNDKCYYFVRQQDTNKCGFLTAYDLITNKWDTPVEIEDTQSRSDFIYYNGGLYLFHAPIDREHIGIVKINTDDISKSEVLLQAKMKSSCFYPFVQCFLDGELAISYTVERKHIRLAKFNLNRYL